MFLLPTLSFLASLATVKALDNGLGTTTLLGFNSWNIFACNVNETVLMKTMVSIQPDLWPRGDTLLVSGKTRDPLTVLFLLPSLVWSSWCLLVSFHHFKRFSLTLMYLSTPPHHENTGQLRFHGSP